MIARITRRTMSMPRLQLTSLLSIDSQGSTYALRSSLRIVGCGRFALSS